ncbi:hypothetical protein, partial [Candidatus Ruminimicrobium bovinum]|uniref:hypothetical protein n=1 Tax=Candidatus Ruminimicrobium bovinum TaxID=3242779 RepID=UPI0039B8B08E
PIILNFNKENSQIDILNENKAGEEDVYKKLITFASKLRGYGKGIEDINEQLNRFRKSHNKVIKTGTENTGWQYFDNFKDNKREISRASLKLNDNKNENVLYRGKSKNSFIVKISEQDMFYVMPFTAPFKQKSYVITAKNNNIMQEGVEYFFPWAYGLEIKDEKENTVITKAQELNENIKIIPVSEFSQIKFATVTLDELSRKYFSKGTNILEKQNIKDNIGENIFLEDLIRSNPDQIINILNKIDKNIKEGEKITIYPLRNYNHKKVKSEISEQDYDMFVQLYKNLNSVISNFCDNYRDKLFDNEKIDNLDDKTKTALEKELRYGLIEMIKNAIVHGNHLDLSKPITVEFDKENFQVKILNNFSKEETNSVLQHIAAVAGLAGFGLGIEKMSDQDNFFNYSDNFNNEERTKSTASLKLKQKNNSNKIKNEIKSKIDIEDNIAEFFIEHIISIPDNELLKILKGTKSEILKMIFDEWDKTLFNLGPNSEIRKKLNKINIIVETNDNNSISFGLLGINAENGNVLDRYFGEEKIKDLIENVKNIHITYIDDNEFDNYKVQYEKTLNKYRLSNNRHKFIEKEIINKMGFNRENLITLGTNEFIKDKESFKENLFSSLQKGNLVALFPFSSPETSAQDSIYKYKYVNREFFKPISAYLSKQMKINADNDISEILKNTFVHGNNLSFDKPIFLYIKNNRLYITNVVDKKNIAGNYQKSLAVLANLTGYHQGIDFIKSNPRLDYKYSDIDKLKTGDIYEASIKIEKIKRNVEYNGKYANSYDTSFIIELPDNKGYNSKYIYIQPIKGKLAVRAVDDNDNLNDSRQIEYLSKLGTEKLEQYGIEAIKENNKDFTISFKENVKFYRLYDKKIINFDYDNDSVKKRNEENKEFLNNIGIDASKKITDISQEELSSVEDTSNVNIVLNLQMLNNNDDEKKKKIIRNNINYALKNGIPIIVYPYIGNDIKDLPALNKLFDITLRKLQYFKKIFAEIISENWKMDNKDIEFSLFEILKNSIVHGNNADLLSPIIIKTNIENNKITEVQIINNNDNNKNSNIYKKFIATVREWHGQGIGIQKMRKSENIEYSDNSRNKDNRTPNDRLWITTISKKENAIDKKSLFDKIKIDEDTADYLIKRGYINQNCMDSLSNNNKTEFLIKLSNNMEDILKRNEFEFETIENVNFVIEKKDGTLFSLKPTYVSYGEYKLNIKAINGDHFNFLAKEKDLNELRNELLSFNDKTKNIDDIIETIYIFNERDYIEYEQKYTYNLKNFNSDLVKNMLNMHDFDKIDLNKENIGVFTLDSFIKDKEQFISDLFNYLSQGKKIALFPFSLKETSIKDSIFMYQYLNKEFFVELSNMLTRELKKKSDFNITNNFSIAINELLKNAFVHGNNLAVDKPIFLYVEDKKLCVSNIVDKETNLTNYQKIVAVLANLTGIHTGNNFIKMFIPQADYEHSDTDKLKTGDIYEASIKVGNINSIENKKMAGIKNSNLSKVYEFLLKGIPPSLVNIYVVLKETLEIFFTPTSFKNAHEHGRQQGAKTLVKQADILKKVVAALSLSVISLSVITGTLPFLLAIQIIIGAVISMFGISAATHYYINYEFINDVKDVINKNRENIKDGILTVKIVNKNIDEDININNIKLVNSGLKINGEIVWINKTNKELVIYCKEQNYEEILPVAKNIALKTTKANKVTEFCVDTRETAPEITEKDGITIINSSVYNELKENKISDTEIASAIKEANIMEQKTNTLYSVSKNNQIFLEYEIKDDISYNNFINKVLSENLGFGYVIDIETVNKYGKNFEMKIEQAKKEKNINIYIKGKDKQINFKRIENFNDIKTLEEQIEKVNFSEDIPLIPASKLFSLVDKERFTDKFVMLNKLANLLFIKREY